MNISRSRFPFLSDDEVQDPVLHIHFLTDLFSLNVLLHFRTLQSGVHHFLLGSIYIDLDGSTELSVDLDGNGGGVRGRVSRIPLGPTLKEDGWLMAGALPQLLCKMRRERRDRHEERLNGFLVRCFIHGSDFIGEL